MARNGVNCAGLLLALSCAPQDPAIGGFRDRSGALDFVHDTGARGNAFLPETMGSGIALLDIENDGDLDLYLVQGGPPSDAGTAAAPRNRLFRNEGGWRFIDVTADSGAGDRGVGMGVVAADLDGDGDTDLYICSLGANALLLNDGTGRFTDATAASGAGDTRWSSSAAAGDLDGDGDLDLMVANYLDLSVGSHKWCGRKEEGYRTYCHPDAYPGLPDALLENTGTGADGVPRFRDRAVAAGVDKASWTEGKGLGVVVLDLDGDSDQDVYVANDSTANYLWQNRGDGTFEGVGAWAGAAYNADGQTEAGMGIGVLDLNGDLAPDLLVSHLDDETHTLYASAGPMLFEDRTDAVGLAPPTILVVGFGVSTADFDLDGRTDAFLANGHLQPNIGLYKSHVAFEQPDFLLTAAPGGVFTVGPAVPAAHRASRSSAAGDLDGDGDADLVVTSMGGPVVLLDNQAAGSSLVLALSQDGPNPDAIGARVVLRTGDDRPQVRWILAGSSYQASEDPRALFGLGRAGDGSVTVTWPDGVRQEFGPLAAGSHLLRRRP